MPSLAKITEKSLAAYLNGGRSGMVEYHRSLIGKHLTGVGPITGTDSSLVVEARGVFTAKVRLVAYTPPIGDVDVSFVLAGRFDPI